MPREQDIARIAADRRAATASASSRAQAQARRAQAEQAARIAEQKRRFQAQSARAQAQARRAASEQAARIAQQQARAAATSQAADAARAAKGHTVRRGDTAETIANQYGVSAKSIADQVKTLRPGQRISVSQRTAIRGGIETQARLKQELDDLRKPQAGSTIPDPALGATPFSNWIKEHILTPLNETRMGIENRTIFRADGELRDDRQAWLESQLFPSGVEEGPIGAGYDDPSVEPGSAQRYPDYSDAKEQFVRAFMAEEGMTRDEYEQYAQERGDFGVTMRYTGSALGEALRLQTEGESYDHIVAGGTGIFEGNVLYITSRAWNNGQGDPMWEQFSPAMQEKIIGLGYKEIEPGLWIPMETQPPDYGMGGYGFPGYGGGFGGGGDYEYLSRGGVDRRRQGGGESRGERVRIFPEGISPTHWRI